MLCVTVVYLRDRTNTIFVILLLNVSHLSIVFSCFLMFSMVYFVADELETSAKAIKSPKILSLEEIRRQKALKEQQQKQEEREGKFRDHHPSPLCVSVAVFAISCQKCFNFFEISFKISIASTFISHEMCPCKKKKKDWHFCVRLVAV